MGRSSSVCGLEQAYGGQPPHLAPFRPGLLWFVGVMRITCPLSTPSLGIRTFRPTAGLGTLMAAEEPPRPLEPTSPYALAEADNQELISTIVDGSSALAVAQRGRPGGRDQHRCPRPARRPRQRGAAPHRHRRSHPPRGRRHSRPARTRERHQLKDIDADSAPDSLIIDPLRDVSTATWLWH